MSIAADIERAIVLEAEIEVRVTELKAIKKRLDAAALKGPHQPLEDQERDGKQYLAHGTRHRVPILITSDELVKSFQAESPLHLKLCSLMTFEQFGRFFREERIYKTRFEDGKIFRRQAVAVLGAAAAPRFITACLSVDKNGIPKNKIIIALDRAETIGETA